MKTSTTIMSSRKIARAFSCIGPAAVFLSLTLANASAQVQLTDIVVFGAGSSGSWLGQPDVWDTQPAKNYNVWIQSGPSGGPFLNGPTASAAQPNISLSSGNDAFRMLGDPGINNGNFGISLFFNGSSTPSISAFGPMLTSPSQPHAFTADSAPYTPTVSGANYGSVFPGAGALTFTSGDQVITLTDFYWATPSVYGLDLVGQNSIGPDGQLDYVGGISLNVSTVPEPQFPILALGCLAGMGLFRRQRI